MPARPNNFSDAAVQKIIRASKRALIDTGLTDVNGVGRRPIVFYEGELAGSVAPASNGKTAPTSTGAYRWVPIPGDTHDPVWMQADTTHTYKLINRSETIQGGITGTYCIWVRMMNEWRIIWIDC